MSFYDDASLIMYPSGVKSGKIYSQKPTDGTGDLTFTRASTATRVNSSGLIEDVATGVPRIDYSGGGCGKLLLEPQRTNNYLRSEEFDNASWLGSSNLTITADQTTSPDGTTTADLIVPSTALTAKQTYQQLSVTSGQNYTVSLFVKANGYNFFTIDFSVAFSGFSGDFVCFNLATKTVSENAAGLTAGIEDYGNGWYRCYATDTATSTGASRVYLKCQNVSGNANYSGDGVSGQYWWGGQFEQGSYPTSYIPTSGAAVTRVKDASITSGVSSIIGQAEGTIVLEISVFDVESAFGARLTLSDGTSSNRVSIIFKQNNDLSFLIAQGGSVVDEFGTTYNNGETYKIAIRYATNDFKAYVNGIEVADNTSVTTFSPGVLSEVRFDDGFSSNLLYGNVQSLQLYQTALSDAELETLTTI